MSTCLVFGPLSQKYSLSGFFLLSSFLLTYRLIKEFHKPNSNLTLIVLQYFIRRFLRIYVIFISFCFAGIYLKPILKGFISGTYTDLKSAFLLQYAGLNILWTIPPEMRYYFVIPLICLVFYKSETFQPLILVISIGWTVYDQFFNFFNVSWDDGVSYMSNRTHLLQNHFFVFFIGSQLAMAFFLLEKHEKLLMLIKKQWIQILFIVLSIIIAVYAIYFHSGAFGNVYDFKYKKYFLIFRNSIINSLSNVCIVIFKKNKIKTCRVLGDCAFSVSIEF